MTFLLFNRIRHSGMTLVELVVSLSIVSIIMLGVGASLFLVRAALPDTTTPTNDMTKAARALEELTCDLEYAQAIQSHSDTMIQFTVADRTGDATSDVLRYEWSGTAGDPLTRTYNTYPAVVLLDRVQQFGLAYQLRDTYNTLPQTQVSGERVQCTYASAVVAKDCTIMEDQWFTQTLDPSLPAGTMKWKVTRVEFYAKQVGDTTGECKIQIQPLTRGGMPSGVILEEKTLLESTLQTAYAKQVLTFTSVQDLTPDEKLCLVFKWVSGTEACAISGDDSAQGVNAKALFMSTDQGRTWSEQTNESLVFTVTGTVTTQTGTQIQTLHYVNAVDATIQVNTEDRFSMVSSARLLNRPEVTE